MSDQHEPGTDLVRQAAAEAAPEVGRFIGTIFGSASMQLDAMLGDRVGWWRMRQAVKLAARAQKLLDDAGLDPQKVPLRTAVPLLEAASLEEDDGLIDRWAALLANAASRSESVPPSFANVLREIEPTAASALDELYTDYMRLAPDLRDRFTITMFETERPDDFAYHLDNLTRLGLIRSAALGLPKHYEHLTMTAFGRAFVRACRAPNAAEPPVVFETLEEVQRHIDRRKASTPSGPRKS